MNVWFVVALIGFIIISVVMILIILVQRPQGGGLAGAFGGAGATSSDTVFGGRVGDALTNLTIALFVAYLGLAITLSLVNSRMVPPVAGGGAPGTATTPGLTGSTSVTGDPADTSSDFQTLELPEGMDINEITPDQLPELLRNAEQVEQQEIIDADARRRAEAAEGGAEADTEGTDDE